VVEEPSGSRPRERLGTAASDLPPPPTRLEERKMVDGEAQRSEGRLEEEFVLL
jgi:hypothetical protein